MSPEKEFSLGDYVQVKDRIARFYELFAGGRLVTDEVSILTAPDNTQRVMVKALAYRRTDDPLPGVGYSWLQIPGTTPYTRGSEVENAETSAWGRAIGALGILIDGSIATANEIADKQVEAETVAKDPADKSKETVTPLGPITRIGAVVKGSGHHTDLAWRMTPDGFGHLGFLLEVGDGKPRPQVTIEGPVAGELFQRLDMDVSRLHGQKVTVDGEVFEVREPGKALKYRIKASRLATPDWSVPSPQPIAEIPKGDPEPVVPAPGQEALELG